MVEELAGLFLKAINLLEGENEEYSYELAEEWNNILDRYNYETEED